MTSLSFSEPMGFEHFPSTMLDEMRLKTDVLTDKIIFDIFESQGFSDLRRLFSLLNYNETAGRAGDCPPALLEYFERGNDLPKWVSVSKLQKGQDLFARLGMQMVMVLQFKALPISYACKNGAKVLASTGRLISDGDDVSRVSRRLMETAQMVMNAMAPGGFLPGGKAIVTIKKVRLYHSAVRLFLTHPSLNQQPWSYARYGAPINQEEMAGTLMAFSALVLKGIEQIGIDISEEDKDAYMHCWKVVGYFMGLDEHLWVDNYKDGYQLGLQILQRNAAPSPEGVLLTKALIQFGDDLMEERFLKHMPEYLLMFFLEDISKELHMDLAGMLDINQKLNRISRLKGKILVEWMELVGEAHDHGALVRHFVLKYNRKWLKKMMRKHKEKGTIPFMIPSSLAEGWKMT